MFDSIGTYLKDTKLSDEFDIFECGYEDVQPRDPYQYEPIDYYLIHYILKGEGLFFINDEIHHLKNGEGFLIPPNTKNNYYPLVGNPWSYRWIGFKGGLCKEFFQKCGLLTSTKAGTENFTYRYDDKDKMDSLFANVYYYSINNKHLAALGESYHILELLIDKHQEDLRQGMSNSERYVQCALKYIEKNYSSSDLTVERVAKVVQLQRSYLFRLFKRHLNLSPKTYIIQTRLNKSTELLRKGSNTIEEIAYLVGFTNPHHFSRQFSKYKGMSPAKYRSQFISR
ncbi:MULTISPECIES: AraC family transcriptional regulator [Virgibacillus]|uniref:Melibiose operon regulatory protein n=2 Tax=Virgibacillus TaxID=84406 RepID=A0A024QGJ5_9BACI|nr:MULTISPECIES: AraC family transcriptional regulator [Virgibacillus]EQB34675.1 hypothetical protein M948_20015 [Virgibacillus sp. CM-4]MYL43667.1 helix-turn-helix domain-containing protein [Virgibacillus massiliensis]GGJ63630.1 AraC family transcriptional regulator [Virgibacillus kapii]CDQ41619.1 Melibiose operon regulatory protein [Virgibacillus massiliensis]